MHLKHFESDDASSKISTKRENCGARNLLFYRRHDYQSNDTRPNDTQNNNAGHIVPTCSLPLFCLSFVLTADVIYGFS